jgi:hypothetical protein
MANTYTTVYGLTKPEVGADTNAWGGHLNGDLDTIDTHMLSRALVTAQTMAGALNLPSNGLNVGSGQLQVSSGNVSISGSFSGVGGTFSGNVSGVNGTFSGTLGVTGVATLSGNATVGGTLGVTGSATFSSTLSASTAPSIGAHLTNKTYVDGSISSATSNMGYLNIPQSGGSAKTTNYTAILSDQGEMIVMNGTSLTATIPANASVAYQVGTVLTFININSSALSIAITSDTLTLVNSTTTGTRTLNQNGIATAVKVASTSWIISGAGVS